MSESESATRKKRIDTRLKSSLLNWEIIHNDKVIDTSALAAHAVEEYPTETGPADYALFVQGKLLGIIEAKKIAVGAENVLEQAKRYSRGVEQTIGEWRGYKVPFLYSTNGEITFLKMADEKSIEINNKYNWASILRLAGTDLLDHYSEVLRNLRDEPGILGDIFTQAMPRFTNPVNLKKVINMIDEVDWSSMDVDVKGAAFEGLLEKSAAEGKKGAGQYFTPQEHFLCVSINGANEVMNIRVVTIGLVNKSQVHPREVFADVIAERASAVIVAHNHPNGELKPSNEDIAVTKTIKEAASVLGIGLLDHIIFNSKGYYSFVENNEL